MSLELARTATLACLFLLLAHARAAAQQPAPSPEGAPLSARIVARERTLELYLKTLAEEDQGRVLNSALQLTLGAGMVTAGALIDNSIARSLLLLAGTGSVAHGTVRLTMVPNVKERAAAYAALPRFTPQELRARIEFGERALREIAAGMRRTRIVDGTVTMLVAATYVPLWWWLERREDPGYRFGDSAFDFVGVAISAINFGTGLATALVHSDAEQRRDDYTELVANFEREAPGELDRLAKRSSVNFALAVRASGVAVTAHLTF